MLLFCHLLDWRVICSRAPASEQHLGFIPGVLIPPSGDTECCTRRRDMLLQLEAVLILSPELLEPSDSSNKTASRAATHRHLRAPDRNRRHHGNEPNEGGPTLQLFTVIQQLSRRFQSGNADLQPLPPGPESRYAALTTTTD
ncbi:hypothetical protein GN956_G2465 [Arapaima gigas]